ncbi:hypothetical protein FOCC_FOCC016116 [Frankliniella occidentalis]|uniref:Protein FRG1 homolog n=1 Tax=Frankliniella occidentalis TaxID=133901 RepID=A0A6J1S9V0_FRAOC|nr:protein FRG1 homolog [Frankliniella occidentalis]KAE8738395.1 hypothetical protein FOCC_FOCC016116 [Frankliniella occidentalis]
MADYENVKRKKLLFKGEKKSKKRKHKKEKKDTEEAREVVDEDAIQHGGWIHCKSTDLITGSIAIEFGNQTYIKALDNGLFTLGAPHDHGEGPSPEEILTAFPVNETKVAIKSGYGKYLRVGPDGAVTGRSDAVGPMEQWEPVFEDGKMALLSSTGCFMAVDPENDDVVASNRKVGPNEILRVRSSAPQDTTGEDEGPSEEKGNIHEVEENYVRKFQKFQDKKLRIDTTDRTVLKRARDEGALHEALLDRRSKMKADRYCK